MGNKSSSEEAPLTHALYGEVKNLTASNDEKTHTVSFTVADEEEGKTFMNRFNLTNNFTKKHLLLSNSFSMENLLLCGNSKSLNCVFPFYPYSLEQEIESRSLAKTFLSKEELMCLVYQIIDGARNFDNIAEKVGDIRPSQILLNETKKNVKLVNFFTGPKQSTGLEKAIDLKEKPFLAPEELKAAQKNNPTPLINVSKADAFSLGLTILAIGNLKKLNEELYDWSDYSFSWTQLSNELETFENRYGSFLVEIVKAFLHNEPRNRVYIGEIGALLQFYEKHIYEVLDFEPDFNLLEKTYQLNYSGPKSEGFMKWLQSVREIHERRFIVQKKVIITEQPKVHHSKVKFYYTSPGVSKINQNTEQD